MILRVVRNIAYFLLGYLTIPVTLSVNEHLKRKAGVPRVF